mgnify:CR=1 FL=1
MIDKTELNKLRSELSIKAKNGLDFTFSASIIWIIIGFIWTLDKTSYSKSILTFYVGILMLPLAYLLSKLLKTTWTIKSNPLQPLGLWLNFAQLFYFPFLFFTLSKMPDYFVMVYVIITGGHFFPYSWFYKNSLFAIAAGISVVGALFLGFNLTIEKIYLIPLFFSAILAILTIFLYYDFKQKERKEGMIK